MNNYFSKYKNHLKPPYSRNDIPAFLSIIFILALVPATVFLASRLTHIFSDAASSSRVVIVDPATQQPITSTSSVEVGVLLYAPWPIAEANVKGQVAGLMAQKNTGTTTGTKGSNTATTAPVNTTKATAAPTANSGTRTPAPTTTSNLRTVSIQLAQDAAFTQNLVSLNSINASPYFTRYTFSNNTAGIKTLYAKFVSSSGSSQVFSTTVRLGSVTVTNPPTVTTPPIGGGGGTRPYPNAPLCPDSGSAHNNTVYHGIWDSARGCHYDHEHGQNPLDSRLAATFPGFNLTQLTGGVTIGHTNPSSGMENTHKHGGFKWQFMPQHPQGCAGFESSANGVNGSLVQVHGFGDYAMELQGRIHSSLALLRMCNQANPNDYGYLYTVQFQDYGQIVSPYQGDIVGFPFNPSVAYDPARGPYLTIDCVGQKGSTERGACRASREEVVTRRLNANSNWASKPSGAANIRSPFGSTLFNLFFRVKDTYQLLDWSDKTYPFTFKWLCSSDGGATFDPSGCRYNNSTLQVHEIAGRIPPEWDNLSGFDSDSRTGRITATGYTDRFGVLKRTCTTPSVGNDRSTDCFPIKMVNAFVGTYGSVLVFLDNKGTNLVPLMPRKDVFFCNGVECGETDTGAVPSGWIGQNN